MKKFETEIIKLSIPPTSVFQSEKVWLTTAANAVKVPVQLLY